MQRFAWHHLPLVHKAHDICMVISKVSLTKVPPDALGMKMHNADSRSVSDQREQSWQCRTFVGLRDHFQHSFATCQFLTFVYIVFPSGVKHIFPEEFRGLFI